MPECQKSNDGFDQYGSERLDRLVLPQSEKSCGNEKIKLQTSIASVSSRHVRITTFISQNMAKYVYGTLLEAPFPSP